LFLDQQVIFQEMKNAASDPPTTKLNLTPIKSITNCAPLSVSPPALPAIEVIAASTIQTFDQLSFNLYD
jgi:hypothetical protein